MDSWRKVYTATFKRVDLSSLTALEDVLNSNPIWINRLLPILKTFIAKMFKTDPVITVLPAHGEYSDQAKSRYAEEVVKYVLVNNDYNTKRLTVATDVFLYGRGWWKVFWGKVRPEDSGEDVVIQAIHPWEVVEDPLSNRFVIHRFYIPEDEAVERFEEPYRKLFKGELPKLKTRQYVGIEGKSLEGVEIIEYYERPSVYHKNGRMLIFADDKLVWKGDLPFWGFPLVLVRESVAQGTEEHSTMKHLLSPATYYNVLLNFILKNIEAMGSVYWGLPEGYLRVAQIENVPGRILLYPPGSPPYQIQPKPLPYHVSQLLQNMLLELEEISGQHEVSHGKAPYANMPAASLQILLENDDTKLNMTRTLFYEALKKVAIKILKIANKKYRPSKTIYAVGKPAAQPLEIVGKDITFSDVRIEVTSNMPLTHAGQINFALMLWDRGLVRDPQKILALLGLDNIKMFEEEVISDINKARRENEMLKGIVAAVHTAKGKSPEEFSNAYQAALSMAESYVLPMENHDVHIKEHLTFMKINGWEEWDPFTKEVFKAHLEAHVRAKQEELQKLQPPNKGAGQEFKELPSEGQAPQPSGQAIPPELMAMLGNLPQGT